MDFKMNSNDYMAPMFDLLVVTHAKQDALTQMIFDHLGSKGEDVDRILKKYKADLEESISKLRDQVFQQYGSLNISDILGKKNNP